MVDFGSRVHVLVGIGFAICSLRFKASGRGFWFLFPHSLVFIKNWMLLSQLGFSLRRSSATARGQTADGATHHVSSNIDGAPHPLIIYAAEYLSRLVPAAAMRRK